MAKCYCTKDSINCSHSNKKLFDDWDTLESLIDQFLNRFGDENILRWLLSQKENSILNSNLLMIRNDSTARIQHKQEQKKNTTSHISRVRAIIPETSPPSSNSPLIQNIEILTSASQLVPLIENLCRHILPWQAVCCPRAIELLREDRSRRALALFSEVVSSHREVAAGHVSSFSADFSHRFEEWVSGQLNFWNEQMKRVETLHQSLFLSFATDQEQREKVQERAGFLRASSWALESDREETVRFRELFDLIYSQEEKRKRGVDYTPSDLGSSSIPLPYSDTRSFEASISLATSSLTPQSHQQMNQQQMKVEDSFEALCCLADKVLAKGVATEHTHTVYREIEMAREKLETSISRWRASSEIGFHETLEKVKGVTKAVFVQTRKLLIREQLLGRGFSEYLSLVMSSHIHSYTEEFKKKDLLWENKALAERSQAYLRRQEASLKELTQPTHIQQEECFRVLQSLRTEIGDRLDRWTRNFSSDEVHRKAFFHQKFAKYINKFDNKRVRKFKQTLRSRQEHISIEQESQTRVTSFLSELRASSDQLWGQEKLREGKLRDLFRYRLKKMNSLSLSSEIPFHLIDPLERLERELGDFDPSWPSRLSIPIKERESSIIKGQQSKWDGTFDAFRVCFVEGCQGLRDRLRILWRESLRAHPSHDHIELHGTQSTPHNNHHDIHSGKDKVLHPFQRCREILEKFQTKRHKEMKQFSHHQLASISSQFSEMLVDFDAHLRTQFIEIKRLDQNIQFEIQQTCLRDEGLASHFEQSSLMRFEAFWTDNWRKLEVEVRQEIERRRFEFDIKKQRAINPHRVLTNPPSTSNLKAFPSKNVSVQNFISDSPADSQSASSSSPQPVSPPSGHSRFDQERKRISAACLRVFQNLDPEQMKSLGLKIIYHLERVLQKRRERWIEIEEEKEKKNFEKTEKERIEKERERKKERLEKEKRKKLMMLKMKQKGVSVPIEETQPSEYIQEGTTEPTPSPLHTTPNSTSLVPPPHMNDSLPIYIVLKVLLTKCDLYFEHALLSRLCLHDPDSDFCFKMLVHNPFFSRGLFSLTTSLYVLSSLRMSLSPLPPPSSNQSDAEPNPTPDPPPFHVSFSSLSKFLLYSPTQPYYSPGLQQMVFHGLSSLSFHLNERGRDFLLSDCIWTLKKFQFEKLPSFVSHFSPPQEDREGRGVVSFKHSDKKDDEALSGEIETGIRRRLNQEVERVFELVRGEGAEKEQLFTDHTHLEPSAPTSIPSFSCPSVDLVNRILSSVSPSNDDPCLTLPSHLPTSLLSTLHSAINVSPNTSTLHHHPPHSTSSSSLPVSLMFLVHTASVDPIESISPSHLLSLSPPHGSSNSMNKSKKAPPPPPPSPSPPSSAAASHLPPHSPSRDLSLLSALLGRSSLSLDTSPIPVLQSLIFLRVVNLSILLTSLNPHSSSISSSSPLHIPTLHDYFTSFSQSMSIITSPPSAISLPSPSSPSNPDPDLRSPSSSYSVESVSLSSSLPSNSFLPPITPLNPPSLPSSIKNSSHPPPSPSILQHCQISPLQLVSHLLSQLRSPSPSILLEGTLFSLPISLSHLQSLSVLSRSLSSDPFLLSPFSSFDAFQLFSGTKELLSLLTTDQPIPSISPPYSPLSSPFSSPFFCPNISSVSLGTHAERLLKNMDKSGLGLFPLESLRNHLITPISNDSKPSPSFTHTQISLLFFTLVRFHLLIPDSSNVSHSKPSATLPNHIPLIDVNLSEYLDDYRSQVASSLSLCPLLSPASVIGAPFHHSPSLSQVLPSITKSILNDQLSPPPSSSTSTPRSSSSFPSLHSPFQQNSSKSTPSKSYVSSILSPPPPTPTSLCFWSSTSPLPLSSLLPPISTLLDSISSFPPHNFPSLLCSPQPNHCSAQLTSFLSSLQSIELSFLISYSPYCELMMKKEFFPFESESFPSPENISELRIERVDKLLLVWKSRQMSEWAEELYKLRLNRYEERSQEIGRYLTSHNAIYSNIIRSGVAKREKLMSDFKQFQQSVLKKCEEMETGDPSFLFHLSFFSDAINFVEGHISTAIEKASPHFDRYHSSLEQGLQLPIQRIHSTRNLFLTFFKNSTRSSLAHFLELPTSHEANPSMELSPLSSSILTIKPNHSESFFININTSPHFSTFRKLRTEMSSLSEQVRRNVSILLHSFSIYDPLTMELEVVDGRQLLLFQLGEESSPSDQPSLSEYPSRLASYIQSKETAVKSDSNQFRNQTRSVYDSLSELWKQIQAKKDNFSSQMEEILDQYQTSRDLFQSKIKSSICKDEELSYLHEWDELRAIFQQKYQSNLLDFTHSTEHLISESVTRCDHSLQQIKQKFLFDFQRKSNTETTFLSSSSQYFARLLESQVASLRLSCSGEISLLRDAQYYLSNINILAIVQPLRQSFLDHHSKFLNSSQFLDSSLCRQFQSSLDSIQVEMLGVFSNLNPLLKDASRGLLRSLESSQRQLSELFENSRVSLYQDADDIVLQRMSLLDAISFSFHDSLASLPLLLEEDTREEHSTIIKLCLGEECDRRHSNDNHSISTLSSPLNLPFIEPFDPIRPQVESVLDSVVFAVMLQDSLISCFSTLHSSLEYERQTVEDSIEEFIQSQFEPSQSSNSQAVSSKISGTQSLITSFDQELKLQFIWREGEIGGVEKGRDVIRQRCINTIDETIFQTKQVILARTSEDNHDVSPSPLPTVSSPHLIAPTTKRKVASINSDLATFISTLAINDALTSISRLENSRTYTISSHSATLDSTLVQTETSISLTSTLNASSSVESESNPKPPSPLTAMHSIQSLPSLHSFHSLLTSHEKQLQSLVSFFSSCGLTSLRAQRVGLEAVLLGFSSPSQLANQFRARGVRGQGTDSKDDLLSKLKDELCLEAEEAELIAPYLSDLSNHSHHSSSSLFDPSLLDSKSIHPISLSDNDVPEIGEELLFSRSFVSLDNEKNESDSQIDKEEGYGEYEGYEGYPILGHMLEEENNEI